MSLRNKGFRLALLSATALAGAAVLAPASQAWAQAREYTFDMRPQSLSAALKAFGAEADQQIMFTESLVRGRDAPELKGVYTADAGLGKLLAGTNLVASRTAEGVVQIRSASDPGPQGASAGGGAETNVVQELVVTAQKKSENIQVVPIAISAFSQKDLTTRQVTGGPDLMTQVPNMTFTKTNFSSYSIQIRGIGTQAISATTDAAVAVAFNNTPFITNRFFEQEFYDLERVEVLRGPQGTLYGRNATAGVVNIISAKPSFDYEEKLSADFGNYSSKRLEGMVNMPLVEDKVALRLAGAWTKRDGYDTNQITGKQIDGRDLWSTRLSLKFEPTDRIRANLIWEHFQENDDRLRSGKQLCKKDVPTEIGGVPVPDNGGFAGEPQNVYSQGCSPVSMYSPEAFETPNGFALPYYAPLIQLSFAGVKNFDPYLSTTQSRNLRVIESTRDPVYNAKTNVAEFQFAYDIAPNLTLSSESGYDSDFVFSSEDYNRFNTAPGAFQPASHAIAGPGTLDENGVFCDPQLGCSNRLQAADLSTAWSRQFSEEVRLTSDFDGRFNFSVGANFLRYDTENKYYVFFNSLTLFQVQIGQAVGGGKAGFPNNDQTAMWPTYVPGVWDNSVCLHGKQYGNPTQPHSFSCAYIDPNPIGSLNDEGHNYFLSRNPYRLISYAAFGEAYFNITPTLKLTGGLRWTVDKKRAPLIPSWLIAATSYGYPVAEVVKQDWSEPTGRLALDWKPELGFTEQTLVYASYAHGYKAGGMNPPSAVIATLTSGAGGGGDFAGLLQGFIVQPKTFKPEFVNAFEIGTKNTLLDGRLTLNLTGFFYDYTGYQISEIVNRSAVNQNFDAKVWGAEVEADWRPLKNLRLGFKGGYENTRVADGMKAIDLMDRTAGDPNYVVARPFPTIPSNCIIPVWFATFGGEIRTPNELNGSEGMCSLAYNQHLDPVTKLPYVPNPTVVAGGEEQLAQWPNYPGFDPSTVPNNGEGIFKNLSGNQLPNAPHFTATVTADYTIPLPHDWLLTLHGDYYHQSSAWTRIFNFDPYDRLHPYTNLNFAAIFNNEAAGLTAMLYVKNALNTDAITGAFLNSDDSGLTTNVFLLEPRLFGIRVTKQWSGTPLWGDRQASHHTPGAPYPLRVEIGGSVERLDAPNQVWAPDFTRSFTSPGLPFPLYPQSQGVDWGDGRDVKLTYAPGGGAWNVSLGYRRDKADMSDHVQHQERTPGGCFLVNPCPEGAYRPGKYDYADTKLSAGEAHTLIDFALGKDFGIGSDTGAINSSIDFGLRYARFKSTSSFSLGGIPDYHVAPEKLTKYPRTNHRYESSLEASRSFKGFGPVLSWEASKALLGDDEIGHVRADGAISAGVLFGKQKASVRSEVNSSYYYSGPLGPSFETHDTAFQRSSRSHSVTVPVLDLSAGLSYEIQRVKVGAGYRWERYFNAIDGGIDTRKQEDRTIDGPYFKVSVGFGG